jgi:hypothetical protein
MRRSFVFLTVVVTALIFIAPAAWADVPTNMNVQGRLTDSTGAPVAPGAWQFTFRIFDVDAGGTQIWPANGANGEEQIIVMGTDGLWTTAVGIDTALTEVVFQDTSRWLEVTVTNFIDPAEVMPRMKLNTNPFAYRAASAQQADSIGGNSFLDLDDLYVNASGDNMTGSLSLDGGSFINNSDIVASQGAVSVQSLNGGSKSIFPIPGHWGVLSEVSSSTSTIKIGVGSFVSCNPGGGYTAGVEALINGNNGAGDTYAIRGFNSANGTGEHFSGFFDGGDFVVQSPSTAGTDGVILPADAISDFEIEDEPGLSQSIESFVYLGVSGTVYVVDSVEINCPTSGYVEVSGQFGWINIVHTNGSTTEIWCKIDKVRESTALGDGSQVWRWPSTQPNSGVLAVPMQTSRVYSESAGTQKYYLHMYFLYGADTDPNIGRPFIRATFYPTLYGTTTLAESIEGKKDADVSMTVATDGSEALPALSIREITLEEHNATLEAELADMRTRLKALEDRASSAMTSSHAEER